MHYRNLIAAICAVVISVGCDPAQPDGGAGASYQSELDRVDRAIEQLAARANPSDGDWLTHEQLAASYMARARLSGDYADYPPWQ